MVSKKHYKIVNCCKILVVSPFLRMIIKPGKSRKGEKPTSEKRRKINGLKVSKINCLLEVSNDKAEDKSLRNIS